MIVNAFGSVVNHLQRIHNEIQLIYNAFTMHLQLIYN
jgi:hypothetical protein